MTPSEWADAQAKKIPELLKELNGILIETHKKKMERIYDINTKGVGGFLGDMGNVKFRYKPGPVYISQTKGVTKKGKPGGINKSNRKTGYFTSYAAYKQAAWGTSHVNLKLTESLSRDHLTAFTQVSETTWEDRLKFTRNGKKMTGLKRKYGQFSHLNADEITFIQDEFGKSRKRLKV